jgi:PadR family transcriptional regulator, regulatory protein PadR
MSKDNSSSSLLQGALDLLVLKSLARHPRMHGYGITLHIQTHSENLLRVEEGSLYPALHRMEQAGWIKAEWGVSENNRKARFYSLTSAGKKRVESEVESYMAVAEAVGRFLKFA